MYALKMKWPVFPCRIRGKEPLTPHGFKDATTDEARIRAWWTQWPNANIATPTGLSMWVLDKDPWNGGNESLETLTQKYGPLPDTLQQMTGGDGRHYCFTTGTGVRIRCGTIAPGLDYKGEGGYILLAPSIHPNGKAYVWDGLDPIDKQPILPLNGAWLKLMGTNGAKAAPDPEEPIFAGERNTRLTSQAGKLRRAGFDKETIYITLNAQNNRLCHPPLEESEVRKIVESIGRYPPGADKPPQAEPPPAPESDSSPNPQSKPRREALLQAQFAIRTHPDWAGVLSFDQFRYKIILQSKPPFYCDRSFPCEWTDVDDINTAVWLQSKHIHAAPLTASQAVQIIARENSFHPVRDYLNALKWDKISRIDDWILLYLGYHPSQEGDKEGSAERDRYIRAVAARWLIGAVARVFQPGSKNDCCLILEGEQGTLKSTALKTLAGIWFTDTMPHLGSKDAALQTQGVWIIELSELDAMSAAGIDSIKAFMSRASDRFRPPYGRYIIDVPRECVFAGTTNHFAYLKDETGARRFWPVRCGKILLEVLQRDRDQLWAEALYRYRRGDKWWLDSDELLETASAEQEARFNDDPWEPVISAYVYAKSDVTVSELLKYAIEKPEKDWSQSDKNRVSKCLQRLRWERFQARLETGRREWRYRPLKYATASK